VSIFSSEHFTFQKAWPFFFPFFSWMTGRYLPDITEQNGNKLCQCCMLVTPSELGIPEISAPLITLWEKKRQIFQEHSSSRVLPYTNKFCSKISTETKGHQKFNNMKKLASNQGGYITFKKPETVLQTLEPLFGLGQCTVILNRHRPVHCQIEPSPTSAPCRMDGVWSLDRKKYVCCIPSP